MLGNDKYTTLKAAFMYYTVPGATPLQQLMTDALILAHARCALSAVQAPPAAPACPL